MYYVQVMTDKCLNLNNSSQSRNCNITGTSQVSALSNDSYGRVLGCTFSLLLKACTVAADVELSGSLFHCGMVFATKCFLSWVVSHRGTMSLSLVARPRVARGFLMIPSSSAGTATSSCRILYRKASLEIRLLSSRGSNPRFAIILVTLDLCPKSVWIHRAAFLWEASSSFVWSFW